MVKYFYLKKETPAQTKAKLDTVHGKSALKTVCFWIHEFKRGQTLTKNEGLERPAEVTTLQVIEKFILLLWKMVE